LVWGKKKKKHPVNPAKSCYPVKASRKSKAEWRFGLDNRHHRESRGISIVYRLLSQYY